MESEMFYIFGHIELKLDGLREYHHSCLFLKVFKTRREHHNPQSSVGIFKNVGPLDKDGGNLDTAADGEDDRRQEIRGREIDAHACA